MPCCRLSSGVRLIDEDQGNRIIPVGAPPDRGLQDGFDVELVVGGEVEQALRPCRVWPGAACCSGGVRRWSPPASGRCGGQSAPRRPGFADRPGRAGSSRAGSGDCPRCCGRSPAGSGCGFGGGQDEKAIRADLALVRAPAEGIADRIRVGPELALRHPGFQLDLSSISGRPRPGPGENR